MSIFVTGVFCSCNKNTLSSSIPDAYVNFTVDVVKYNVLNPGDYIINKGQGYGGVILLKTPTANYAAFDLSCPYEHSPSIKVVPNDSISVWIATCPKCGSRYEMLNGTGQPVDGSLSNEALRPYNASRSGNIVYVTNNH